MISKFTRSFLLSCIALLLIGSLFFLNPPIRIYHDAVNHAWFNEDGVDPSLQKPQPPPAPPQVEAGTVNGGVIMGKLGNETAKAELGRATWKLLHTMTLRFPETPTDDEREALRAYIHLTSRLYPCGECAEHFQKLLEEYPPQVRV
ncbi:hypothetical protein FRC16_001776 [Serendipita sp. 398]|nr:hypothetical protein FRC16_001776 [Serendipita sp. 398]